MEIIIYIMDTLYIDGKSPEKLLLIVLIYTAIFLVGLAILHRFEKDNFEQKFPSIFYVVFSTIILVGLVVRLTYAYSPLVHPDVTTFFIPWTESLMNNPLSDFYFLNGDPSNINRLHDYTPLYMYVLSFIGFLSKTFDVSELGMLFLQRLPAIICDVFATIFIFKIAKLVTKKSFYAMAISAFYFLCPAVILNSAMWGQVDGITSMIFIIAFYYMLKEKDLIAIFVCMIGMCFKIQFIFLAPAIGMYYIFRWIKHNETFIPSMMGFLYGAIFFLIINIPFTYKIILSGNILFPFEIYFNQVSNYSYYTLNAFNVWGILNLNFAELPNTILFGMFNFLSIAVPCAFTAYYLYKKPSIWSVPLMAAFVITTVFVFSFKMHERYMFGAIIALIILLVRKFDWHLFATTIMCIITVFMNTGLLMIIAHKSFDYIDNRMVIGGWLSLISFLLLFSYILRLLYTDDKIELIEKTQVEFTEEIQSELSEETQAETVNFISNNWF